MPEIRRTLQAVLPDSVEEGSVPDESQHIERALVPIFIFDAECHAMLAANTAALRLYGYGKTEFLRLNLGDIRPPEEAARARRIAESWPPGLRYSGVWLHRARDGRVFSVSAMGLRIAFKGRPAILTIINDLTQTLRLHDTPAETGSPVFPFAEVMDEVCWIRNVEDDRLVYANPALERVFGLSHEAIYAEPEAVQRLVLAEDLDAFLTYKAARQRGPARVEYRIRRPDGEVRWIAARSYLFEDASGAPLAAGFSEDITERKAEEHGRLAAVEAQRDALVREVHHRIKNSLQGVTGLLRRFAAAHPQLAPLLAEAAAQVQGLAAVHGLQGRDASGRVELCALLRNVADAAQAQMQARIEADIPPHCDPCLDIAGQDAVPVALALNEAVVNAIKHGKPGARVRLAATIDAATGTAEIRIANRGRLPAGFDPAAGAGSGLQLIRMLLPPRGARFSLAGNKGEVTATLQLRAPVIASR
jgi:PAS domain S-box-containing protein